MKVLITDGISPEAIKILTEAGHEVTDIKLTPEELLAQIPNYDCIIVRSASKVTKEVIEAGVNLKAIARGGVGLDNIDVAFAKSKGIPVLNTPGASSISVAELAIAHMFAVSRFLQLSNTEMRQGKWPKKEYSKGIELTGKTLGLLTIAEGIEEGSQLNHLKHQGCDEGQGFLFSKPLPAEEVEQLILRSSSLVGAR